MRIVRACRPQAATRTHADMRRPPGVALFFFAPERFMAFASVRDFMMMMISNSNGFCGFQLCVIASLRSPDLTQGRKVEMDAPAFFHIREEATASDHRNVRNRRILGSRAASRPLHHANATG